MRSPSRILNCSTYPVPTDIDNSQELLDYVNFRHSTFLNYRQASDIGPEHYGSLITKAVQFVGQDLPTSILSGSDDPNFMLELGVRQWTGYGAPQDRSAAVAIWMVVASYRENVPVPLKARAHSLLTRGWFEFAQENLPRTLNLSHLIDAGNSANGAVALGLISPVVLKVASKIELIGFRRAEDNLKFPEHSTEPFERLTDLWEAWDARKAEMIKEDLKREAKVSKNPLSYFCAAEDCGIVATKKSTLRRCGGRCPQEFKPAYCSKYCQTADRKHHRPYCKPDATESSVRSNGDANAAAVEREPGPQKEAPSSGGFQPGPERTIGINIGGQTFRISSTTMDPQFLRWVREEVEKLAAANGLNFL